MNEFSAAMGICNLKHIEEEIGKRRKVVERYRANLENIDGIKLSPIQKDVVPNYAYFPVYSMKKFLVQQEMKCLKSLQKMIFAQESIFIH